MSAQAQPILAASAAMLDMIQGFWVSRAICVAAELGIPVSLVKTTRIRRINNLRKLRLAGIR